MTVTALRPETLASSELPEGWSLSRLSTLCAINPPKISLDVLEPDQTVTFIPMPAVDAEKGAIASPQERPFSEVRRGFTSFKDGDVIMAKITPCMENGKAAIAHDLSNGIGFGSTEFHVLRTKGAVLPEFVYYFIRQRSFRRAAESEMTGSVGQKRVPAAFLESSELPVPPQAEQERIIQKIEQLLARVSVARERLAHVPTILKRFRQAVLVAACSGRLTADWREQSEVNRYWCEDLEARLKNRASGEKKSEWYQPNFETRPSVELPEGWHYIALGNLGNWISGGTPATGKAAYWDGGETPWLSAKDMKAEVIVDAQDHITSRAVEETRLRLLPASSLAFVVRGLILAHSFPVALLSRPMTINQDLRAIVSARM